MPCDLSTFFTIFCSSSRNARMILRRERGSPGKDSTQSDPRFAPKPALGGAGAPRRCCHCRCRHRRQSPVSASDHVFYSARRRARGARAPPHVFKGIQHGNFIRCARPASPTATATATAAVTATGTATGTATHRPQTKRKKKVDIPVAQRVAGENAAVAARHRLFPLGKAHALLGAHDGDAEERAARVGAFRDGRQLLDVLDGELAARGAHPAPGAGWGERRRRIGGCEGQWGCAQAGASGAAGRIGRRCRGGQTI